ncbi:DGF-1-like protein, putative [Bodo saltans]|uniref:DGF-1-like protein, putative n=1 Tax=Bodo saltans TaxID=75058 RepID=A0A0S4JJC4_BODSA|nr:DGF-1-like protein, putative [Bodo saltans]|eukprot:CUG91643.1 DGF-1-like protein, putative [Bodo saltans]
MQKYANMLLLLLVLCATSALGQQIKYYSGNYGGTMIQVGAGVSIVKVNQASFTGGGGITFNLGSMMTAAQPIVIEVCGLTLSNGAIMYFLGASSVAGNKPAYITVTGVTSQNGGIGLGAGIFPWYTRLIAKTITYTIDNSAASFAALASYGPATPTCLLMAGLTLQKTVVRFTANTINGALRNGLFPIRYNAFVCSDYSVWMLDNTYIGNSFAFHGHNPVVTSNAVFLISKVNAVCDRFCISFESGVTVSDGGAFIIEDSTASADGHDLLFISGPLTVSGGGLFMAAGNYFITPRFAFSISSGASTTGATSLISFANNNLLGLPWHMGCSGNCRVQCNMLGQAQLSTVAQYQTAGLSTPSVASPCDVRTKCAAYTIGCYQPLTASGGTSPNCCVCKPGGYGKYCLPVELPNIPEMCVATATVPMVTKTHILTQTESISTSASGRFNQNHDFVARTKTLTLTLTVAVTLTPRMTPSPSAVVTPSAYRPSFSHVLSPSRTIALTPSDSESGSVTASLSPSVTFSPSVTDSMNLTVSGTATATFNVTETGSATLTESVTVTGTASVTRSPTRTHVLSLSVSPSLGHCIWNRSRLDMPRTYGYMQVIPYFPLAMTQATSGYNYTLAVPYADAFNGYRLTLASLGQWQVVDAAAVGEASFVLFENSTLSDSAVISVGPPAERYTNVLLRTAFVTVRFRCATTYYSETFVIVILPEDPVVQEGVVNDVLAAALSSGIILASPPVAAAAAWAMIFQQLMLCKSLAENSAISFTGLTIGGDGLRYLRGAIIANFAIVAAQAVVVMVIGGVVAVAARSRDPKARFVRTLGVLQWPQVMHISISALLLLNMTASVALVGGDGAAEDYFLAILGASCCVGYALQMCVKLYATHRAAKAQGNNRQWHVAQSLGSDHFIYGNYKRPWFAGYEAANSVVIGLIAGLPSGSLICELQLWAIFVASLIILCLVAYYRPMKTLLSLVFVGAIHLLTFIAANAMLLAHYVPSQRTSAFNVATIVLLVIPLVALLKAVTDITAFVMHGRVLFDRLTMSDKSLYDFGEDDGQDDDEEELAPKQEVGAVATEADDLNTFLLAIDAEGAKETMRKKNKKSTGFSSVQHVPLHEDVDNNHGTELHEDEIYSSLKL